MSKIMRVYYDNAGYPYKDRELSTLYPIIGNEFTGANNTTEIHFYCENLGQATWVANCKLPNGTKVNRLLVSGVDENGYTYQNLPLDSELTSVVGHLKIGLNGYAGNISVDEEELENNDLVVISGTPTIIATGVIDIAMNYSPIVIPVSDLTPTEYQELLGLIGGKVDVLNTILVVNDISLLDPSAYNENQILYSKSNSVFYKVVNSEFVVEDVAHNKVDKSTEPLILYGTTDLGAQTTYSFNDVADQVGGIVLSNYYTRIESDTRYVQKASGFNIVYCNVDPGVPTTICFTNEATAYTLAYRRDGGRLQVGAPIYSNDATTRKYVDDLHTIAMEVANGKCNSFVLSYQENMANVKDQIINSHVKKAYRYDYQNGIFTDITQEVAAGDWDNIVVANPTFNSQNDSLVFYPTSPTRYLIFEGFKNNETDYGDYLILEMNNSSLRKLFNMGDIIWVKETVDSHGDNLPDRWVSNTTTPFKLYAMETAKVDLTNYATYSGTNVFTGSNTFDTSNVSFTDGFTTGGNIIPTSPNSKSIGSYALYFADTHTSELYVNTFKDLSGSKELSYSDLYGTLLGADTYPTTELQWNGFNTILVTTNTTFTKKVAPANTYPEYRGTISYGVAQQSITLTFTGIRTILCNDDNIVIVNGTNSTLTLPPKTSIEFSIVGVNMVAINWSAN